MCRGHKCKCVDFCSPVSVWGGWYKLSGCDVYLCVCQGKRTCTWMAGYRNQGRLPGGVDCEAYSERTNKG